MKMHAQKPLLRFCLRRPEVGFDYYWMWSNTLDFIRVWYHDARHINPRENLYIQKWENNALIELPIDAKMLDEEAQRLLFGKK